MRIAQINSVSGIRSTGRIVTDLADALIEQGHSCRIYYGRETVPEKYRAISTKIGTDAEVGLHVLETRFFDRHGLGSQKDTRELVRMLRDYDPDVIHLHNLHGYYLNLPILFDYLANSGKPVVWLLHDCWAFTGHCSYYTAAGCSRWKIGCFRCPQKREYPTCLGWDRSRKNWQEKRELFDSLKNLTIVTPSAWLAGEVRQSFLGQYPVRVIRNSIDTQTFRPTQSDFREKNDLVGKRILLGVCANWGEPAKGLADFVKLSTMLAPEEKLVLVGLTPGQRKSLPSEILVIERTNSTRELAEIYSAADIFLNLTYEDNYPTTNLEAQACGTPCITYPTGGSVESVPSENVAPAGDLRRVLELSRMPLALTDLPLERSAMLEEYWKLYCALTDGEKG